jgi:hypothetical protein
MRRIQAIICASLLSSAVPAQSAEQSWGSLALQGLGTWATCAGISLGTTVIATYITALSGECIKPGSIELIAFGKTDSIIDAQKESHPFLRPLWFPKGFGLLNLLGFSQSMVTADIDRKIAFYIPGILAKAGLSLVAYAAVNHFLPQQRSIVRDIWLKTNSACYLLHFFSMDDRQHFGTRIQEELEIGSTLYNALAIPAVAYTAYKIARL